MKIMIHKRESRF